jgi:hypothetical protein
VVDAGPPPRDRSTATHRWQRRLVGQLGLQPERYVVDYWNEAVRAVGASRVVLIHWDDFFRPLHDPLRALPYAGDDLDVSMRVLTGLAAEDGIPLHLPTLWDRADPWS